MSGMNHVIYVSGPMSGYEDHNFKAFNFCAEKLRGMGYCVVNPAELDSAETTKESWNYYLKRDIRHLLNCDSVAALSGWENSKGATLEVYIAWRLGMNVYRASDMEAMDVSRFDFSAIERESNAGVFLRAFTVKKMERPKEPKSFGGGINLGAHNGAATQGYEERLSTGPLKTRCIIGSTPHGKSNWLKDEFINKSREKEKPENILKEADRLVGGDRGDQYGHPIQDFARTAAIWGAILGIKVDPEQVALCMVGVKISRQCHKAKRDNWTDMAGYAQTGYMVNQKQGKVE